MRQGLRQLQLQQSNEPTPAPSGIVRFDASLFKPALLTTTEGLENAVSHVLAVAACREPLKALHVILSGLCDERNLFEFFYGGNCLKSTYVSCF